MELRFLERVIPAGQPNAGSLQRLLQQREGPFLPWRDVPVYTLAEQAQEAAEALTDAENAKHSAQLGLFS